MTTVMRSWIMIAGIGLSASALVAQAPYYAVRTIGQPGAMVPSNMSPSGIIAGTMIVGGSSSAFVWTNGTVNEYPFPSWGKSEGLAVNDLGLVVGRVVQGSRVRPFYASRYTGIVTFDPLGTRFGSALDVDAFGRIVGTAASPDSPSDFVPFVWQFGQGFQLPIPTGFRSGVANSINDVGVIAGSVTGIRELPSVWDKDGLSILPMPAGYHSGNVRHLSDLLTYVGSVTTFDGKRTSAMRWMPDFKPQMLPDLGGSFSEAKSVNDWGYIVGSSLRADGTSAGVLWIGNEVFDLSEHLSLRPDVTIEQAIGIDALGRIVAIGTVGGYSNVPILLRPVPAPSALMGVLVGLGFVTRRRR